MKEYKFAYANKFCKILDYFLTFISNLLVIIFIIPVIAVIVFLLLARFEPVGPIIAFVLSVIVFVLAVVLTMFFSFRKYSVVVTDYAVIINKHNICDFWQGVGADACILYKDIKECEIYDGPRWYYRTIGDIYCMGFYDTNEAVRIIDSRNRRYVFAVENSLDFLSFVDDKLDEFNNAENDLT